MLIQEPYSYRRIIPNTEGGRTYAMKGNPKAEIVIYNEEIESMLIRDLSDSHHVRIKMFLGKGRISIVNHILTSNHI